MKTSGRNEKLDDELLRFEEQWTRNMVIYWQERIDKLRVVDTGTMRNSITGMLHPGPITTIEHSFLIYGKYVSEGVSAAFGWKYWGNNIPKGEQRTPRQRMNGGQLEFLDKTYRRNHGLDVSKKVGPAWGGRVAGGTPKGQRDWFYRKYWASRMVLNEMEAAAYGIQYKGMLTVAIDTIFDKKRFM